MYCTELGSSGIADRLVSHRMAECGTPCRSRCTLRQARSFPALLTAGVAAAVVFGSPQYSHAQPLPSPLLQMEHLSPREARFKQTSPGISTSQMASEALQLLRSAENLIDAGQYQAALHCYTQIVESYGELALATYARIGRGLLLYQVGRTSDALLALEDEEISFKGSAQVHAALAALLYAERPTQIFKAEQEWNVAQEFDTRYVDIEWVKTKKHWPPKALDSLQRFLQLQ